MSERVIARINCGSHGHAPVELSEAHVQCSERIDTLRQRGVRCLRPQHSQIYNSFAALTTGREYSLNSVANQGRLLQVGVGAIQPLGMTEEMIDPLDNLVIELRSQGIDACGISPLIPDNTVWQEVGLYSGVVQRIPFRSASFTSVLCLALFDQSYEGLNRAIAMNRLLFRSAAVELHRVLVDRGYLYVFGSGVAKGAVTALITQGFKRCGEVLKQSRRGEYMVFQKGNS